MRATPPNSISFRYVRWKALLFGAVASSLGMLMIWLGVEALDPAWSAHVARGQYLVDAPVWIRAPVMLATGAVVLSPGLWLLFSTLTSCAVIAANQQTISARTLFGRLRQLAWTQIVEAKRKKNQIVLSPVGADTLGQEIWDRRSVFLDVGMLDAARGELEALIALHRPDLVIRSAK